MMALTLLQYWQAQVYKQNRLDFDGETALALVQESTFYVLDKTYCVVVNESGAYEFISDGTKIVSINEIPEEFVTGGES